MDKLLITQLAVIVAAVPTYRVINGVVPNYKVVTMIRILSLTYAHRGNTKSLLFGSEETVNLTI